MRGFLLFCVLFLSCTGNRAEDHSLQQDSSISPPAGTVGSIPLPTGYKRIPAPAHSYLSYLRSIPLKKDRTVYLFNGTKKGNQEAQYAVLAIDAGTKDLQQCADAVMRIRSEYLYHEQQYGQITFRFTNGFNCDYEHYAKGYRVVMKGQQCSWKLQKAENRSYATFREYLDLVYAYAGTKSLHAQLEAAPFGAMSPGQVFIQTRNPYGHAVTIMDMASNPQTKDTVFLLSQSYMPAQDIHILRNPGQNKLSPWYSKRFDGDLETPEWVFTKEDLRTF